MKVRCSSISTKDDGSSVSSRKQPYGYLPYWRRVRRFAVGGWHPAERWLGSRPVPGGQDFPKKGNLFPDPSDRPDTHTAFAEHDDGQTKRLRYC